MASGDHDAPCPLERGDYLLAPNMVVLGEEGVDGAVGHEVREQEIDRHPRSAEAGAAPLAADMTDLLISGARHRMSKILHRR